MKKTTSAILCSAAAAVCLGAILCSSGVVPSTALSYGIASAADPWSVRAMTLSLPALPSDLQREAGGTEEPKAEQAVGLTLPVFAAADYSVFTPKNPGGAEKIVQKQYASSLSVNNKSSVDIDMDALVKKVPALDLSGDGPQILIVHTHTSESYNETGQDWYSDQDTRTTDNSRNMVHMGEILDQTLTQRGYRVIHCQKRHDEDFNASYDQSLATVKEYLKKYPSIAVVIDLHRDSLIDSGGTKYRPTVVIDGIETAQVMFLMGVGNETYQHPNWKENLSLAARIQKEANETYPGLMRPILVRPLRYNQYLSNGALLVELGACGNTPAEAEQAARLFGEVCATALDKIREEQE